MNDVLREPLGTLPLPFDTPDGVPPADALVALQAMLHTARTQSTARLARAQAKRERRRLRNLHLR